FAFQAAAYLDDQQVAFNHRSAADAEKVLHHMELGARVDFPHFLAIRGLNAVKHPLDAVDVNPIAIHNRTAARPIVVAVVVLIICRIFEFPEQLCGRAPKAAQTSFVAMAIEQKEPAPADGRHAISHSNGHLPDYSKSRCAPRGDDTFLLRDTGSQRSQEL